jgi:predicted nucleotidyltransferase
MSAAFDDLLARAQNDPNVLGLILSGSHARGMATDNSDVDVFVIVPEYSEAWGKTLHSPELDEIPYSLADLKDKSARWMRYSFRGARVLMDRLNGGVTELVDAQARLTPQEADLWARESLDAYLNSIYRAAKSHRDGRADLARLDEIEAPAWFLEALFALFGRVRPYNKYLRWELETYPLPAPWTAANLISTLPERPGAFFAELEGLARQTGLGDVFDGWDELKFIRAHAA